MSTTSTPAPAGATIPLPNRQEPRFRIRTYFEHSNGEAGSKTVAIQELSNSEIVALGRAVQADVQRRKAAKAGAA